MQLSGIDPYIVSILPPVTTHPKNMVDTLLPQIPPNSVNGLLMNKISMESALQNLLMELKNKSMAVDSNLGYEKYVAPNPNIRKLAREITVGASSNDEKMYKIEQWVQENIAYQSDTKTYGMPEYWAMPQQTMNKEVGDCEDGAFLTHALGLAAGVPSEKLRTYGGIVFNPTTGMPAGHGWVAYQRETDNEWIPLDWCYWTMSSDLDSRTPMSMRREYIDDFWYITENKTVATPIANKVRYASQLSEDTKGSFINITT
jgi:hypothetical protein